MCLNGTQAPKQGHNKHQLHKPVLHHVPLLSCLDPAELHLFWKVIPLAAAAICEQQVFQLQTRIITHVSAAIFPPY